MLPCYSKELIELALSKPYEVKKVEQVLIAFILDRYWCRKPPQSQLLRFDPLLASHIDLLCELVQHYGLSCHNAAEQCTLLIVMLDEQIPVIPKCSLVRFAKSQIQLQEDSTKSSKYSQSRLRINRASVPATAAAESKNSLAAASADSLVCICVLDEEAFSGNSRYAALRDEDETVKGKEISPSDVCCVCLDPLLQVTRAQKGESLCVLKCKHVLHSNCAQKVRTYNAGSTPIVGVVSNGTLAPDLGPMRCPICRSESVNTIEAPLKLTTLKGHIVASTSLEVSNNKPVKKSKGKKKNVEETEETEDDLYLELVGMGFEDSAVRDEISRTGGDKQAAVNNLLAAATECF
jgi:hypothetical protein